MNVKISRALLLAASMLLACPLVKAGVVINGTRVIYPQKAREVTVQVENTGEVPALVQAWIDSGDASVTADNSDAPFVLMPPISRVEPGKSQALRILFSGNRLPADQESVFWLNILDVPPKPVADGDEQNNYLQVAFRSRIKLFYRPDGLPGQANDAPKHLRLIRVGGERVKLENPSVYHVTLVEIRAGADASGPLIEGAGKMLAPGQSIELPLASSYQQINYVTVNDYGGRVARASQVVVPSP